MLIPSFRIQSCIKVLSARLGSLGLPNSRIEWPALPPEATYSSSPALLLSTATAPLPSSCDPLAPEFQARVESLGTVLATFQDAVQKTLNGGGEKAVARHRCDMPYFAGRCM